MTRIPFNVNDYVRVRLTETGLAIHKALHDDLMAQLPNASTLVYEPPKVDAEGWSRWQLWHLMQDFGPHILMGAKAPFETEIQFEVNL